MINVCLFQSDGMHFARDKSSVTSKPNMQCAALCHHKHDKFLGTYRDRKHVSHWGGNGLFSCLPARIFPDCRNTAIQGLVHSLSQLLAADF